MAGTLTVDTIQSDSSYASRINVTSNVAFSSPVTFNTPANFAGGMQIGGQDATFGGMRNRIINGDMRIDQRNSGSSITVSAGGGGYAIDRFYIENFQSGTITAQQSSVAPTGFLNSIIHTVTSTDTPASGDYLFESTSIEGLNMADLGWGTANAQTVTLTFWVRSSVTGTYGVGLRNSAGNRSYVATYTILQANTWEKETITIPGDTSGTWLTTNGLGVRIFFDLGSGSNFNGTANTWNAGSYWRTSGCVNFISNSGATFYLAGVQLEKGSAASAFEYRHYGQELALCQRYYFKESGTMYGGRYSSGSGFAGATCLPVVMRANPSLGYAGVATTQDLYPYVSLSSAQYLMTSISPYVTGLTASAEI
jgi:hypothetical protein